MIFLRLLYQPLIIKLYSYNTSLLQRITDINSKTELQIDLNAIDN